MDTNNDGGTKNKKRDSDFRARKISFLKRKDCIMKKAMELSVLCDVKACALVLGPDGHLETWPENRSEVMQVIDMYRDYYCVKNKMKGSKKRKREIHEIKKQKKMMMKNMEDDYRGYLLRKIDAKLEKVNNRIRILKQPEAGESSDYKYKDFSPAGGGEEVNASTCFDEIDWFMDNTIMMNNIGVGVGVSLLQGQGQGQGQGQDFDSYIKKYNDQYSHSAWQLGMMNDNIQQPFDSTNIGIQIPFGGVEEFTGLQPTSTMDSCYDLTAAIGTWSSTTQNTSILSDEYWFHEKDVALQSAASTMYSCTQNFTTFSDYWLQNIQIPFGDLP